MNDHELLIRHTVKWAGQKGRPVDEDVLTEVLDLRARHDDLPIGTWPPGSAKRLLMVTWPAHGAPPPPREALRDTLDTFWRFLRATGRMSVSSASPAELLKEAKRHLPRMATANGEPAPHSPTQALMDFGRSIGVNLDDAPDLEAAQERMATITEAWNALPDEERRRLMPDPSPTAGGRALFTPSMAGMLGQDEHGTVPWPERGPVDEDDVPGVEPGDLRVSARLARESGFVQDCLRLAEWVGTGKQVTSAGLLRPAVAREAYQHLDLWPWERERQAIKYRSDDRVPMPRDAEEDAAMAEQALHSWRSAGDCLALDRLWYPCVSAGLIDVGSTRATQAQVDLEDDEAWRKLTMVLLTALCMRLGTYALEPLAGILLIAHVAQEPASREAVSAWWDSRFPENWRELGLASRWRRRLDGAWFQLRECGLWRSTGENYELTDLGRDFLIVYANAMDKGWFDR